MPKRPTRPPARLCPAALDRFVPPPRFRTATRLASVLALSLFASASGQPLYPESISTRSHSGQFIISAAVPAADRSLANALASKPQFVRLDPMLLTVSCERIKQLVVHELGATPAWRGKIYVALRPVEAGDYSVRITSERFKDGWQYRVELPDVVERRLYVRGIVQVLLLEMANRKAGERSAEIPSWLAEGLSEQLLAGNGMEIILPPPRGSVNGLALSSTVVNARRTNSLDHAHKQLRLRPPLAFEELSWPKEEGAGEDSDLYRSSAQLFVNELLRLKDGRACLVAMLNELPLHENWQFALLRAFHSSFTATRDVEKWWALHRLHFSGRDLAPTWPADQSWQKLAQMVRAPVQVRTSANELPLHTDVSLQTIIREWEGVQQSRALRNKMSELELARLRVSPEFVSVVDGYHKVLETYLLEREKGGFLFRFRKKAAASRAAREAIEQLDALDARREELRPAPGNNGTVQAQLSTAPGPKTSKTAKPKVRIP